MIAHSSRHPKEEFLGTTLKSSSLVVCERQLSCTAAHDLQALTDKAGTRGSPSRAVLSVLSEGCAAAQSSSLVLCVISAASFMRRIPACHSEPDKACSNAVAAGREENNNKVARQTTGQGFYPFLKEEPQIWRVSPYSPVDSVAHLMIVFFMIHVWGHLVRDVASM